MVSAMREKMKVAFYLENRNIPDVDFTEPEKGNPGCGGNEFLYAVLPYYLAKFNGEDCEPVLLANHTLKLPFNVGHIKADDVYDAARKAKESKCDFFIYRAKRKEELDVLDLIEELKLPTICWAHITPTTPVLRKMAQTPSFKAMVLTEGEQFDQSQDSPLATKIALIVNGFDWEGFALKNPPIKDHKSVIYLGALVRQKGFHVLAKAWPKVLQRVPDAKLTVIGTGALYNASAKLGPWNIADVIYEEKNIIPYLSGPDGKPHPSVYFAGKLGHEKKEIIAKALIGVPNPTGDTENCPGSVVEIEALGTAVVTGAYWGMMDTVVHGVTGLLGRTEEDLVNNICHLLENPGQAIEMGQSGIRFVRERYNYQKASAEWMQLFKTIQNNQKIVQAPFKRNIFRHYKLFIMVNRPLQILFGRFIQWPSVSDMRIWGFRKLQKLKGVA